MSKELVKDELFIDDQLTPMTELEAAEALRDGWKLALGSEATLNQTGCLWAQSYLETAGWKSIHNWNWGNIKKTSGHTWTMYPCHEYLPDGKGGAIKQKFFPPHVQTGFNAYEDAAQGAKEYIEFLKNRPRYKDAWVGLMTGDLAEFNRGLKKGGYYTAPEDAYLKTLTIYFKKFHKNSADLIKPAPPVIIPEEVEPEPKPNIWEGAFKFIHELLSKIK